MDAFLRREEVEARTSLSRSSIYRLMRSGVFPEPVKISSRAVRWRSSEIEQFLDSRPRATGVNS